MKKCYQTEWQGIRFSEFTEPSSTMLAQRDFYQRFYATFFQRYRRWEQLPASWTSEKALWARFLITRIPKTSRVLSVGCGLGAIEHYIRAQESSFRLYIHEVAPTAWGWIGGEFPEDRKFIGMIPECLPKGLKFDYVYLATVDYALDDDSLVGLLAAIRTSLSDSEHPGECLIISSSFDESPNTAMERLIALFRRLRRTAAALLDVLRIRPRGQLWGWRRTRLEYHGLMRRAGYTNIEDGFICPTERTHYWIAGRCPQITRDEDAQS